MLALKQKNTLPCLCTENITFTKNKGFNITKKACYKVEGPDRITIFLYSQIEIIICFSQGLSILVTNYSECLICCLWFIFWTFPWCYLFPFTPTFFIEPLLVLCFNLIFCHIIWMLQNSELCTSLCKTVFYFCS